MQERKNCKGWEITGQREDFGGFIVRGRHFWVILRPSLEFVCSQGKCLQCLAAWPRCPRASGLKQGRRHK